MLCGKCGKNLKFKGIAQRGEGRDKEKWRCTCGYIEFLTDWESHPPINEIKQQKRKSKKITRKSKSKVKKRSKTKVKKRTKTKVKKKRGRKKK